MKILSSVISDPELQLQREIIERCKRQIQFQTERRTESDLESWMQISAELKAVIESAFPLHLFHKQVKLVSHLVSQHEFDDYRIENVIFESLPGWEVNGTVYLPKKPGRYPAVVCPTGHSSKTRESYQTAAQVFARNGYVAISFDPPGCAGEIAHLNDHFTNGLIGYLTGIWSNSHFVFDALRCIDYLETRDDVDASAGITMTGVSGGGCTSVYASLLDERVRFYAPVCCLGEHEGIHFTDLYTSCPEQFGPNFIEKGIDFVDLIAIQAPKPCLIIGGMLDEVFDHKSITRIFQEAANMYRLQGQEHQLGFFMQEDSGHAYTVEMATEVVRWMNRLIKQADAKPLLITREEICIQPPELLFCYPSNEVNMFTINQDAGRQLSQSRSLPVGPARLTYAQEKVRECLGLEHNKTWEQPDYAWKVTEKIRPPVWSCQFHEVILHGTDNMHIPGLFSTRVKSSMRTMEDKKRPAMLFIDEAGKWEGFRQGNYLTQVIGVLSREEREGEPSIYSIDVSGMGELKPQPAAYDVASWNDIERILTYLSIASGKPVMGLRVRDALHAWQYLKSRSDVDTDRLIIAGRGSGAIIALLTALFAGEFHKLIMWEGLLNYQALTEDFPFAWPQSIMIPNLLKYGDLQDFLPLIPCAEKILINPQDAMRRNVTKEQAEQLYSSGISIYVNKTEKEARACFVEAVYGHQEGN